MAKTLHPSAGSMGLNPAGELRSNMTWGQNKQKKKKLKQYRNKFNKDIKNGPHRKVENNNQTKFV